MAEEVENLDQAETGDGITVEVVADPDDKVGKPRLTDEEVAAMDNVPDDEIGRYATDAQKRIRSLKASNQEWKRRAVQGTRDVATATNLAEQLYRENQQLKTMQQRSEAALIDQALQRAEAQLEQAKTRARIAVASNDADAIVTANEEVARFVAEADRLRLLKPPAGRAATDGESAQPAAAPPVQPAPPQPRPVSQGVQNWIQKNPWFGKPGSEEMTGFAMGIHQNLAAQGVTEDKDPEKYWATIDKRLREVYPDQFKDPAKEALAESRRPAAVTGGTRVNGAGTPAAKPRHVTLTESEVRIARSLGITNEAYAAQKIKDQGKERGLVQ